jgi:AraC-like DNA-binding protein
LNYSEFIELNGLPIIGLCYHDIPPRDENISQKSYHTLKIVYVRHGRGMWDVGDKRYQITPGDIFIFNNDEKRSIRTIYPPENLLLSVIDFEPRFIWSNHQDLFDSSYLKVFFERKNNEFENRIPCDSVISVQLRKIIEEMEDELQTKKYQYEQMIKVKLLNILVILNRHYAEFFRMSGKPSMPEHHYLLISQVLNYIDEHLNEDLSRQLLADYIHMNSSSLSKIFKKYNGIGLTQYIIRKRIHYSVHLLKNTDLSVLEIANRCGFNTTANYYKAFKLVTGDIPSSYREK